jgi:LPXTG-motif cell wall-anchored protein
MKLKTTIAAAVACLVLAIPSAALAVSPTQDAYGGIAGQQQGGGGPAPSSDSGQTAPVSEVSQVPSGNVATSSSDTSGTLPFTGFEVGMIAVVGLALLGGGVLLFRYSRRAEPQA